MSTHVHETVKVISDGAGFGRVYDGDRFLGQVRREWQARQDRPGHVTSELVWFAVPLARVAHANPDGCPWFRLRRDAVAALVEGFVLR